MPAVLFASVPYNGDPDAVVLVAVSSPITAWKLLDKAPASDTVARVVITRAEDWRAWAGVLRLWVDTVGHHWQGSDLRDSAVLEDIFAFQLRTATPLGPRARASCVTDTPVV
jgi:hypothetical protein